MLISQLANKNHAGYELRSVTAGQAIRNGEERFSLTLLLLPQNAGLETRNHVYVLYTFVYL